MVDPEPLRRGPRPSCECGECAKCRQRVYERRWRHKNPEKQREYRAKRKAYLASYRAKNRERLNAADLARYHASVEVKQKSAARRKVNKAVAAGRLVRLPCETCAAEPTEAHHDDYSKPLDVRWLCALCHGAEHAISPARKVAA